MTIKKFSTRCRVQGNVSSVDVPSQQRCKLFPLTLQLDRIRLYYCISLSLLSSTVTLHNFDTCMRRPDSPELNFLSLFIITAISIHSCSPVLYPFYVKTERGESTVKLQFLLILVFIQLQFSIMLSHTDCLGFSPRPFAANGPPNLCCKTGLLLVQ